MKKKSLNFAFWITLGLVAFAESSENSDILKDQKVISTYHRSVLSEANRGVRIIGREEIQKRNLSNLRDLMQTLSGVQIQDDPALLSSSLKLNGVSGENIKIMVDGIPLVGLVSGTIDINQISLQDVESVEIVESPLAVEYGSNALGGVINIKTRPAPKGDKWKFNVGSSVESSRKLAGHIGVGKRFGNHNLSANLGSTIQDEFNPEGMESEGRRPVFFPSTLYRWDIKYGWGNKNLNTQFKYLGVLDFKLSKGQWEPDPTSLEFDSGLGEFVAQDSLANDMEYTTQRHTYQNVSNWVPRRGENIRTQISYSNYTREKSYLINSYKAGSVEDVQEVILDTLGDGSVDSIQVDKTSEDLYSSYLGSLVYKNEKFKRVPFLLGVEAENYETQGERILDDKQSLQGASLFGSSSIKVLRELALELGVRAQYNSKFEVKTLGSLPIIPSLGASWSQGPKSKLSFGYSRGFRAPSLQELYFSFHDGGAHDVDGNPNLNPEKSHNYYLNLVQHSRKKQNIVHTQKYSSYFHSLEEQIILAEDLTRDGMYLYQNLASFNSLGLSMENSWTHKKGFNLSVLLGVHGESILEDEKAISYAYLVRPDASISLGFMHPKWLSGINYFHRYHGETPVYQTEEGVLEQGLTEGWHQMDISYTQKFKKSLKGLVINIGIKNLMDVSELQTRGAASIGSSAHSSGEKASVARGRLYFTSFNYDI